MQVVRTILWVLLFVGLLAFSFFNWKPVEVTIWDNLILETKVPALVIVSFLLGMIPTWLLLRGTKWRLKRRINTLENAAKSAAMMQHADDDTASMPMTSTAAPMMSPASLDPATTEPELAPTLSADPVVIAPPGDLDRTIDGPNERPADPAITRQP